MAPVLTEYRHLLLRGEWTNEANPARSIKRGAGGWPGDCRWKAKAGGRARRALSFSPDGRYLLFGAIGPIPAGPGPGGTDPGGC